MSGFYNCTKIIFVSLDAVSVVAAAAAAVDDDVVAAVAKDVAVVKDIVIVSWFGHHTGLQMRCDSSFNMCVNTGCGTRLIVQVFRRKQ